MSYFTVIIPLYNKENFVENTLKSIVNQTFSDYEVLIVDDCSTDASLTKVQPYLSDKIRIISHTKNSGLSASRNTGIRNAKAQYVTFLDADDTWKPTLLESFYNMLQQFPEQVIFATNYVEVYPNGKIVLPKNSSSDLKPNETILIKDFFKRNKQQGFFIHSVIYLNHEIMRNNKLPK